MSAADTHFIWESDPISFDYAAVTLSCPETVQ